MTIQNHPLADYRQAGVCLHITSLPGPYGIGELGSSAHWFVDKMVEMGLSVWQFLPLGPTAYGDSPYQPLSTFAGNELLIDIRELIAMDLLHESDITDLQELPDEYVDYDALIPAKMRVLRLAADRFSRNANRSERESFETFVARHDSNWLHNYAVFRRLKEIHHQAPWVDWPLRYANRDNAALRAFEATESDAISRFKILQYFFFSQWSTLRNYANRQGVKFFGDLPIYLALDSSDAWSDRSILCLEADGNPKRVAGVPPDYFSADGQLWGNPLYDWDNHAANGFTWWIQRLRATAELVDLIRIDHFRGFESYWSVPAESDSARDGVWEPGPGNAIFDAMQSALGGLPIVAENLGVITPEVEALRLRHNFPGMQVLQFAVCHSEFELSDIDIDSVCYTGTHDNDTTLGWLHGGPGDMRSADDRTRDRNAVRRLTGESTKTVHDDFIIAAFSTASRLAIAPLQDFLGLGSDARMNTPGVAAGNWRWRFLSSHITSRICHNIRSMVSATSRGLPNNGK